MHIGSDKKFFLVETNEIKRPALAATPSVTNLHAQAGRLEAFPLRWQVPEGAMLRRVGASKRTEGIAPQEH